MQEVSKSHFFAKMSKSHSRRQPALPSAKNPLQRPTPGKKILSHFYQKCHFNAKIIFVIKNHFHVKNIFRVDIKNPSPRHHAPTPYNPCRIWSFLEPEMRKVHFFVKSALFGPKVTFPEKLLLNKKALFTEK